MAPLEIIDHAPFEEPRFHPDIKTEDNKNRYRGIWMRRER